MKKSTINKIKAIQGGGFWTKKEIADLKELIANGIHDWRLVYKQGLFPNRSHNSIRMKAYEIKMEGN